MKIGIKITRFVTFVLHFVVINLLIKSSFEVSLNQTSLYNEDKAKYFAKYLHHISCAKRSLKKTCTDCIKPLDGNEFIHFFMTRKRDMPFKLLVHFNDNLEKIYLFFSGPMFNKGNIKYFSKYFLGKKSLEDTESFEGFQINSKLHEIYFEKIKKKIVKVLDRLVKSNRGEFGLVFVGNSVAGSLATLAAYDIQKNFSNKKFKSYEVYAFNSFKFADEKFYKNLKKSKLAIFRIFKDNDFIISPNCSYDMAKSKWKCTKLDENIRKAIAKFTNSTKPKFRNSDLLDNENNQDSDNEEIEDLIDSPQSSVAKSFLEVGFEVKVNSFSNKINQKESKANDNQGKNTNNTNINNNNSNNNNIASNNGNANKPNQEKALTKVNVTNTDNAGKSKNESSKERVEKKKNKKKKDKSKKALKKKNKKQNKNKHKIKDKSPKNTFNDSNNKKKKSLKKKTYEKIKKVAKFIKKQAIKLANTLEIKDLAIKKPSLPKCYVNKPAENSKSIVKVDPGTYGEIILYNSNMQKYESCKPESTKDDCKRCIINLSLPKSIKSYSHLNLFGDKIDTCSFRIKNKFLF